MDMVTRSTVALSWENITKGRSILEGNIVSLCPEIKHTEHYRLSLEEKIPILIIFNTYISGTTCHQMTIRYSTSPIVCFCTTWGKQNQLNMP